MIGVAQVAHIAFGAIGQRDLFKAIGATKFYGRQAEAGNAGITDVTLRAIGQAIIIIKRLAGRA